MLKLFVIENEIVKCVKFSVFFVSENGASPLVRESNEAIRTLQRQLGTITEIRAHQRFRSHSFT